MNEDKKSTTPEEINDEALESVTGAFNPQPDPPGRVAKPISVNPVFQPINVSVRPGG